MTAGKVRVPDAPKDQFFSLNVFETSGYQAHYRNLCKMVKDHIRLDQLPGRKVIDLACGYGWYGQSLLAEGAHVAFNDRRQAHPACPRQPDSNANTHVLNLEAHPVPIPKPHNT